MTYRSINRKKSILISDQSFQTFIKQQLQTLFDSSCSLFCQSLCVLDQLISGERIMETVCSCCRYSDLESNAWSCVLFDDILLIFFRMYSSLHTKRSVLFFMGYYVIVFDPGHLRSDWAGCGLCNDSIENGQCTSDVTRSFPKHHFKAHNLWHCRKGRRQKTPPG